MKKLLFCLCLVFVLCGCEETGTSVSVPEANPDIQSRAPLAELASCVSKEAEGVILVLPISGRTLKVRDEFEVSVSGVDDALVAEADKELPAGCHLYLEVDEEGYLCLCGEEIVSIDPPQVESGTEDEIIDSGCGIDHNHVFYRFRITKKG